MDIYIFISMLSVMYSWILCTVMSAPSGETPTVIPGRHVRTKRCSCATFLDKECVYFCHLDIIWVNTPERVVSYGLGNAPRTRRAVPDSMATGGGPRCRCLREQDTGCGSFCRRENQPRYEASPDAVVGSGEETLWKHELAADTGRSRSRKTSNKKQVSPLALRVALKTHLLLKKWRVRQRHRARAWEGESTAS